MSLKPSQIDMQEHSAKKVELLKLYLKHYLTVLGNDEYTRGIQCYDLFCGEGVYPNGGKGSPIVFAEALLRFARQFPTKNFTLHFNDREPEKVDNVNRHIAKLGELPQNFTAVSSVLNFDRVVERASSQLRVLANEKAFVFVDPYGYREIEPRIIETLLDGGKSEVLLFLPTQHMFRFSTNGTPEALSRFLEGISHGRTFPANSNMGVYLDYIVDGFRILLPSCVVDRFTIRKDPQTAFCLFFFTRNLKGAEKMLEAKWELDAMQGSGWSYEANLAEGLFAKPMINPLEALILKTLKHKPMSNAELYEIVVRAGFLPKHGVEVLTALQKAGSLHIAPAGTRARSFFLNYQATHGANPAKHRRIRISLI